MLAKDLYTGSYFKKSASKAGALKALLAALGIGGLGTLYARNGGLDADREAFYGADVPVSANDMDKQQPGILDYLSNYARIGAASAIAHTGRFFNKKHKESYDNLVPQVYGPTPEEFSAIVKGIQDKSLAASDARDLMRQEALRGSSLGASDARDLMRQEALRGSSLGASDVLEGLRNQNLMERGLPFSNDTDAQQNSEGSLSGYLAQLGHDFSMASDPSQNPNLARVISKQQFLRDLTSPINSLRDYLTSDSTSSKVNAIRNAQDAQQHSTGEETSSWKKSIWDFNRETPNNPIGKSTSTPRIPNVNNPEGEALMSAIAAKLTEGADSVGDTLAEAASREVKPRGSKKKDSE